VRERAPGAGASSDGHDGVAASDPGRRSLTGTLSRKASAGPSAQCAVDQTLASSDTSVGQPVPEHLQERFAATGADVSDVELHTSSASAQAAEAVSARAYTVGQDVHFGAGEYAPGTPDGDFLIAHEVAHTIQQADAPSAPQFGLEVSQPHDAAEVEADQAAAAIVSGGASAMPALSARGPQRKLMRWANDSSALPVVSAIERASAADLQLIVVALGDAEGCADAQVPIDLPGYSGLLARADVHPLFELAQRRAASMPSTIHSSGGGHRDTSSEPSTPPSDDLSLRTGLGPLVSAADAHVRITEYVRPAEEFSRRVMADAAAGRITFAEGRDIASAARTELRLAAREGLSAPGRAMSEAVEHTGPTIGQLADRYSFRILERNAALREEFGIVNLAVEDAATRRAMMAIRESDEVSRAIIIGAGSPNRFMTGAAHFTRVAAPLLVGAQVVSSGYRVLSAEEGEHMWTAGEEVSGIAGGTLGSAAGGVVVSFLGAVAVGAGVTVAAPVAICVSLFVVGGMAMVGSLAGENIWDRHVDHDALRAAELELGRAIEAFANASTGDRIAGAMPMHSLAAGGGLSGLMERDRRRVEEERRRGEPPPETSGGEAP